MFTDKLPITKIFWPKEMREAVNDLKREGTLNYEAIAYLDKSIKAWWKLFLCFSVIYLIAGYDDIALAILIMVGLISFCSINQIFKRYISPYLKGSIKNIVVKDILFRMSLGHGVEVKCYDLETKNEFKIGPLYGKLWKDNDLPKKGSVIEVYYCPTIRYGMPNITYLKNKLSIKVLPNV